MKVEIKADSINPDGERITTMLAEYPRFLHPEHTRHRMFSFSVASSRAIPFKKLCRKAIEDPIIPILTMDQPGMQGVKNEDAELKEKATLLIRGLANTATETAEALSDLGLHKQVVNRYLEPFINVSVLWTGTSEAWNNFFDLRIHEAAEPHIHQLALLCREAMDASDPRKLDWGEWHVPFAEKMGEGLTLKQRLDISAARCARLSYETHNTKKVDHEADLKLANSRLWPLKHVSPFEHQAQAFRDLSMSGNLRNGWAQYRHLKEQ